MTRPAPTLLLWPQPLASFTTSDAWRQVPRALCEQGPVVMLCNAGAGPGDEEGEGFASVEEAGPSLVAYAARARALARLLRPRRIISGFDARALAGGWLAAGESRAPWFPVCEDHPFGMRHGVGPSLAASLHARALRALLARSAAIPCFIHRGVLRFLRLPGDKLLQLSNAADLELVDAIRPATSRASARDAGCIGMVSREKGAIALAHAARALSSQSPGSRLHAIGPLEPGIEGELRAIAGDALVLHGRLPHHEALALLKACGAGLNAYPRRPWLWWNQVLKVCECAALGTAVVSFQTPGVRSLVRDGREAVLVPCGEGRAAGEALGEAAARVLGDRALRARLRAAARARVDKRLNWAFMRGELLRAIHDAEARL